MFNLALIQTLQESFYVSNEQVLEIQFHFWCFNCCAQVYVQRMQLHQVKTLQVTGQVRSLKSQTTSAGSKVFGACRRSGMCSRLVHVDDSQRENFLKLYGWGHWREKRGKQCDVCAVSPELGVSTLFHIPKQLPGGASCVVLSGNDCPRCLHFVKLRFTDRAVTLRLLCATRVLLFSQVQLKLVPIPRDALAFEK